MNLKLTILIMCQIKSTIPEHSSLKFHRKITMATF